MRKDVLTDKKTSKIIKQPHLSHFRQSTEEMVKKKIISTISLKQVGRCLKKQVLLIWRKR